jgi:N-acetylglucosamine kinase-like BadF-type ATPase
MSAILRAYDGRGPKTMMTDMMRAEFKLEARDLPRFVYASTTHADDIARYGKLVVDAAEAGDEVALAIVRRASKELAACVLAVARRLKLLETEFPIAYVGGVFNAGETILTGMRNAIAAEAAKAKLAEPINTPVEGAALMAVRASTNPRPDRAEVLQS